MQNTTLISFRIPEAQIQPLRVKAAQAGFSSVAKFIRSLIDREVKDDRA